MFLRIKDVCGKTGLSRSAIYSLVAADKFPAPRRLTPRTTAWVAEEVEHWATTRPIATNADLNMKPALTGRAQQRAAEKAMSAREKPAHG